MMPCLLVRSEMRVLVPYSGVCLANMSPCVGMVLLCTTVGSGTAYLFCGIVRICERGAFVSSIEYKS